MTKKVLLMIMLLSAMGIRAQEIVKCGSGKTFWLIKEKEKNYAVALPGEVEKSNHPKIITVDGKALQYLVIDKKEHAEKAGSTDDMKVLVTFVSGETGYIASQFMADINIRMEAVQMADGRKAIYWSYNMPAGTSDEVEMQHFLNVVEGDVIFGLASTQFQGDSEAEIKKMLVDTLNSLKTVKEGKDLCK